MRSGGPGSWGPACQDTDHGQTVAPVTPASRKPCVPSFVRGAEGLWLQSTFEAASSSTLHTLTGLVYDLRTCRLSSSLRHALQFQGIFTDLQ